MKLKHIITTLIITVLLVPSLLFAVTTEEKATKEKELIEKILKLEDKEFKEAVIKVLQDNSLTNKKLFLNEIQKLRDSQAGKSIERVYGLENVERYDGWSVTISGILVVFFGLILIAIIVAIFNRFFAGKAEVEPKKKHINIFEEVKEESKATIPEEELVAITTALELYKRLYADNIPSRLTFREVGQGTWKLKYKFGHRQN